MSEFVDDAKMEPVKDGHPECEVELIPFLRYDVTPSWWRQETGRVPGARLLLAVQELVKIGRVHCVRFSRSSLRVHAAWTPEKETAARSAIEAL